MERIKAFQQTLTGQTRGDLNNFRQLQLLPW